MKIIDCEQGSSEWLQARLGIVTASELDALVSPLWKVRTGDGVQTYLARKIAERWRNAPLVSYHGGAMEQGTLREDEARAWFELEHDMSIRRVGFITTDDGRMGCSPDGLLPDGGIEIKCPEPHTHVRYLLANELPSEYVAQVHGSMYVTGLRRWRFLSYCRGFPPLLVTVEFNKAADDAIHTAVTAFNNQLTAAWDAIVKRNGGPPARSAEADAEDEFVFV